MRLYHYLPLEWAIDDLKKSRLKIATFNDLNDPFELIGYEMPGAEHRTFFRKLKRQLSGGMGVLCFSRSWQNPVLWSHYADRHKGVCLGFEVAEKIAVRVTYTSNRMEIDGSVLHGQWTEKHVKQLCSTKCKGWDYEEEVRVFAWLKSNRDESTGLHFCRFYSEVQLKEVIAGPLCMATQDLRNAIPDHEAQGIALVKARLAFRSFKIVRDQRGF
jgi:hypothetical protein